nr:ADP-ribosylation factor-like protein 2 [Tanacetum cinerariifolium]
MKRSSNSDPTLRTPREERYERREAKKREREEEVESITEVQSFRSKKPKMRVIIPTERILISGDLIIQRRSTTIVLKINDEDTSVISPTLGFNIKTMIYDKYVLLAHCRCYRFVVKKNVYCVSYEIDYSIALWEFEYGKSSEMEVQCVKTCKS